MNNSEEKQNYLDRIKKNDEGALKDIYKSYWGAFKVFFSRYGISTTELQDVFQDTVVALYQNVMQGKLTLLDGSIKTYIWSIGKHKVIDLLRKNKKKVYQMHDDHVEPFAVLEPQLNSRQKLLQKHFKSLGQSCQKILKYFYYEGLSVKEIVDTTDYKDVNSVKSSKSRCIKHLRNLINNA